MQPPAAASSSPDLFGLPSREEIEKGTQEEKQKLIERLQSYLEMVKGVEAKGGEDSEMGGV
jgi:hypothetical protein